MKTSRLVKSVLCIAALGAALTGFAACGGGSSGGSGGGGTGANDEDAVTNLMKKDLAAYRKSDGRALYNLASPRFRKACSFDLVADKFQGQVDGLAQDTGVTDLSKIDYTDMKIRVEGNTAKVAFNIRADGKVIDTVDSIDPYVVFKASGAWYVTADTDNCDNPGAASSAQTTEDEATPTAARATATSGRAATSTPASRPTTRAASPTVQATPTIAGEPFGAHATFVINLKGQRFELSGSRCALTYNGTILAIEIDDGSSKVSLQAGDVSGGPVASQLASGRVPWKIGFTTGGVRWMSITAGSSTVFSVTPDLASGTFSADFLSATGNATATGSFTC